MSQHDFNIANQTFPSFRSDLNDALQASATMSAGSSAPTTPYAYQLWFDTTTDTWKVRNSGNTAWISTITTDLATGNVGINQAAPAHPFHVGTDDLIVDASGNLLVGTTDINPAAVSNSVGVSALANGKIEASRDGNAAASFNIKTSDGNIVDFRKDGGTVGSIGTDEGTLYIGRNDTGVIFEGFAADTLVPYNPSTNTIRDDTINLGYSSSRFKDLYLSGGVYLGGTGSANLLDDYEEGTWTGVASTNGFTQTISSITGYYTKIGRLVHVNYIISLSSAGYASGYSRIYGLPFTSLANQVGGYYGNGGISSNGIGNTHFVNGAGANFYLYQSTSTLNTATWVGNFTYMSV